MSEWWNDFRSAEVKRLLRAARRFEALEQTGFGAVHQTAVTMTDTDIANWPITPVTLVTPSASQIVVPLRVVFATHYTANPYTSINADAFMEVKINGVLQVNQIANISGVIAQMDDFLNPALLFGAGADGIWHCLPSQRMTAPVMTAWGGPLATFVGGSVGAVDVVGQPLIVSMDNGGAVAFGGGHSSNTLTITIPHFLFNPTTGELE